MTEKYTKDHEWIRVEGGTAILGITEHAAAALGELVYVELPEIGSKFSKGDSAAVVESSKSASDVYMPIAGEIVSANETLIDNPENVNNSPYQDGWLVKIKINDGALGDLDDYLSKSEYEDYLKENSE